MWCSGSTPPWPYQDRMDMGEGLKECKDESQAVRDECKVEDGHVKCPCGNNAGAVKRAKAMPKGDSKNAALGKSIKGYADSSLLN